MRYICSICGYVYDEAGNIPFEELPEDWKCPLCGAAKADFKLEDAAEPAAVLKYGNRIPDEVYARYTRQFQLKNLPTEELYRVDDEFHRMFISASGNRYFHTVYAMIADQVQRYRVLTANRPQDELAQDEHYEIAACCIRGEWTQASRLMLEHIENAKLFIVRYVLETNRNARNVFLEEDED